MYDRQFPVGGAALGGGGTAAVFGGWDVAAIVIGACMLVFALMALGRVAYKAWS